MYSLEFLKESHMDSSTNNGLLYYGSMALFLYICSYLFVQALTTKFFVGYGMNKQYPPTPTGRLPIIGHLHHLLQGSGSYPQRLNRLATRYGPLLQLQVGASELILVSNAQFAKEILKTKELNFVNHPEVFTPDAHIYTGFGFILAPYGTYWRFFKKICMTTLLSNSQLNQFTHIREQEIKKLLEYLKKLSVGNEFCDMTTPIITLMNNAFCRMAMTMSPSGDVYDEAQKIKELVDEWAEVSGKFLARELFFPWGNLLGYGRNLKKVLRKYDQLVENIMKRHEEIGTDHQGRERRDLMDILMETYKDPNAEVKLTRTHIKAFFFDLFSAAPETSSVAVKWAMAELINHPQIFKKLRQEIDSKTGGAGCRLLKESDIQNLPYLQAVVKETLRLHPPLIATMRETDQDCEINGYYLKAKSRMMINIYSIMRDPNVYENPDEFIPERFLMDPNETVKRQNNNVDYIPFGSGRRSCPGESLALTMLHSTIGALVQCFDWKVKDGEMADLTEAFISAVTLEMANPLLCYPITRFNPFQQQ